jgi:ketosteroid isomerase-like protein
VWAGDELVNEFSWVGTHTGPLLTGAGSIPPSGRTVRSVAVEVWRLRDGKLAELHNYQDAATILAQIGALPMPEPAGL